MDLNEIRAELCMLHFGADELLSDVLHTPLV
jgi:hypothetical protein